MAIWQFHIYFIPRRSLIGKYGHIPAQPEMNKEARADYIEKFNLNEAPGSEDALTISWWKNLNLDINHILPLLQQFGELQQWTATCDGLRCFGDTATNDISVCFDHETKIVEELSCRLDLREIDKEFIDKAISLATQFNCLLMDNRGRLYKPFTENLFEAIQLSNANRFVQDPKQFLDDLSKGIAQPE